MGICNRVTKQFDKSSFDEVVQLLELQLAIVNNCCDLIQNVHNI